MLMDIPRPGMINRLRRFRFPRGLHHCLRCCALGPDSTKPMDKEADQMDIRLRLTPDPPHLFFLLDRPLLQLTSQTMLAHSISQGNIHLPHLVTNTVSHIPLPIPATLLLCLHIHIHRRGSPSPSTILTFPTRHHRATKDHLFSHHPKFLSILRRQTRRPGIHLEAGAITTRPSWLHSRGSRCRPSLVAQPSHQYRHNSLPRVFIRRSRDLRLIRPRSPLSPHLNQDTHRHNLLTSHHLNRDILFHHISRRIPVNTRARTRRMGTPLPLQGPASDLSLDGRARLGKWQILLSCKGTRRRCRSLMIRTLDEVPLHFRFRLCRLPIRQQAPTVRVRSMRGSCRGGGSRRRGMRSWRGSWTTS